MALRNVKAHWRQSLAAILSVTAGFIAYVIFDGYLRDIYRAYTDYNQNLEMYGDLMVEREGFSDVEGRSDPWAFALTEADQLFIFKFLENHRYEVSAAARFIQISGSLETGQASSVFQGIAYDIEPAAIIRGQWGWDTYWGHPLHKTKNVDLKMITGLRLAQKLGCLPDKIEGLERYLLDLERYPKARSFNCENEEFQLSAMTESGQVNAIDLSISGIQDKGFRDLDSRYVVLPLETAQKLFNTKKVSYFSIKLKKNESLSKFITEFNQSLNAEFAHLKMMPWQKHPVGEMYRKTLSLLDVIRTFLISVIIFIGSMSVFNIMVKSVKERTKEMGMLRSLGFFPRQIRLLFYLETLLWSGLGCFSGTILSLLLSWFFNAAEWTYPSGQFSFEAPFIIAVAPSIYASGVILMSFISLLACWLAIRKTSESNIANLLLHH
jgi:hypothetical protein